MALGTFACFCIETRFGPDVSAGARAALRSYARGLESTSAPIAFPDFRRERQPLGSEVELELEVEPEVQASLEREARKQAVQVDQILTHAVFVYLAAMEENSATPRYRGDAPEQPQ